MKKITKELQAKSIKELEKEAYQLRQEIAKIRLGMKVNPPKDTNLLLKKRKRLAVILTVITEKQMLEKLSTEDIKQQEVKE